MRCTAWSLCLYQGKLILDHTQTAHQNSTTVLQWFRQSNSLLRYVAEFVTLQPHVVYFYVGTNN